MEQDVARGFVAAAIFCNLEDSEQSGFELARINADGTWTVNWSAAEVWSKREFTADQHAVMLIAMSRLLLAARGTFPEVSGFDAMMIAARAGVV